MTDKAESRQAMIDMFIRVCRDSGFQLEATNAVILLAKAIGTIPLTVWSKMDLDLQTLERIASGEHPATQLKG